MGNDAGFRLNVLALLQLNKPFPKKEKLKEKFKISGADKIADCFPLCCERGKDGTRGGRQGDQGPLATHRRVEHRVPKPGRYAHYFSLLQTGTAPADALYDALLNLF